MFHLRSPAFRRRRLCTGLSLCLLTCLAVAPGHAARQDADTKAQQAAAEAKLAKVRGQIKQLAEQQRQTASRRDSLSAALASQADTLAAAAKAVRQSEAAISASQAHLHALDTQRDALQTKLHAQRGALAALLRAAYKTGRGSDLRVLLGDQNMSRIARALAYSKYFQHQRMAHIRSLRQALQRLAAVQASIRTETAQLKATRAQRQARVATLHDARARQQQLLTQADAQLKDQQQRMRHLKRNEKALGALIERLRDVFADIPKTLPSDVPFRSLRGHLPWPAHGPVHHQGSGIEIAVSHGHEVRAVAHGRVVYANWLRGYGELLIVDQGNGWMTLYGNNESLLASVGDWVDRGQVIGTAGMRAGDKGGVYFELRHGRHAVDPLPWLGHRK